MPPRKSRATREGKQPVVYKYEIKGDLPAAARAELRLACGLRNRLVEIEHAHDAAVAAVWESHPGTAPLAAAVKTAEDECASLAAELKAARQRQRTRVPDQRRAAALREARARRRQARQAFKDAKAAEGPHVRDRLRDADAARAAAVKACYAPAVAGGLYWATVNDVIARHETARRRVAAIRSEGRPAEMRYRRWDGTGTLTVQLQRGASDPPRTPAVLASDDSKWRNVAALTPAPGKRATLGLRIGAGDCKQVITLSLVMHRPLPPHADIAEVRVTRRRTGATYRCHITFTCLLPAPPARSNGLLAAAHTGWRMLPDGAIRAAVITVPAAPVPPGAEAMVRRHSGWAELVIPARFAGQREKLAAISSRRSLHLEGLRASLTAWLDDHPADRAWLDPDRTLHLWRSPARFAALTTRVRREGALALAACGENPGEAAALAARLEAWRRQDKHLWQWVAHAEDKAIRWRRDCYRQVAAWLCQGAALIAVDGWPLPPLLRQADVTEEDDRQAEAARANARLAAPGELRAAIATAAALRGIRVTRPERPPADVHHGCGGKLPAEGRAQAVMVRCTGCGRMVDQDVNMLNAMTAASGQAVT